VLSDSATQRIDQICSSRGEQEIDDKKCSVMADSAPEQLSAYPKHPSACSRLLFPMTVQQLAEVMLYSYLLKCARFPHCTSLLWPIHTPTVR
jgi:hypothetical protein